MAYSIDTINTESYGMYVSTSEGILNLPQGKEQIFVQYGKEGYQITKRKGNELDLKAFIVADDMPDFISKTTAIYNVFSTSGLRAIVDNNGNAFNAYCKEGYKIDKVFVSGQVIAKINIKLTIV